MSFEFSKSEKKIVRKVIEVGLFREYENGIRKLETIITAWKENKMNNQEAYFKIYDSLKKHDKYIAFRYNDMKGSTYLLILIAQLADGLISENDLAEFSVQTRNHILSVKKSLTD